MEKDQANRRKSESVTLKNQEPYRFKMEDLPLSRLEELKESETYKKMVSDGDPRDLFYDWFKNLEKIEKMDFAKKEDSHPNEGDLLQVPLKKKPKSNLTVDQPKDQEEEENPYL